MVRWRAVSAYLPDVRSADGGERVRIHSGGATCRDPGFRQIARASTARSAMELPSSLPAHGTASINGSTITYTPGPGFNGTDTFDYQAHYGRAIANGTINVFVNRPPVAVDDHVMLQGASPARIDVLANDSDPDNNALSIISVAQPSAGKVTLQGSELLSTGVGQCHLELQIHDIGRAWPDRLGAGLRRGAHHPLGKIDCDPAVARDSRRAAWRTHAAAVSALPARKAAWPRPNSHITAAIAAPSTPPTPELNP